MTELYAWVGIFWFFWGCYTFYKAGYKESRDECIRAALVSIIAVVTAFLMIYAGVNLDEQSLRID